MSLLENIRVFVRVAELGSLSAAWRDLRLSPAVASHRMKPAILGLEMSNSEPMAMWIVCLIRLARCATAVLVFPDRRTGSDGRCKMADIGAAAFSIFFIRIEVLAVGPVEAGQRDGLKLKTVLQQVLGHRVAGERDPTKVRQRRAAIKRILQAGIGITEPMPKTINPRH